MGNLFLGFPVSRAKIADMITGTAAPSAHHTQHENGGSDEIDATGLTGAGGGALFPFDLYRIETPFQALAAFLESNAGSGSNTIGLDGVTMDSGATASSIADMERTGYPSTTVVGWAKSRQMEAHVFFSSDTDAIGEWWLVSGSTGNTRHIGFKVIDGVLYGTCANGSAESTATLQTLGAGTFTATRTLRAVFTAGVDCKFYVDGVLLGTITTNLPTGTTSSDNLCRLRVKNKTTAASKYMIVSHYAITVKI